jgi:uncharacterized protein (TIGR03086 family)
MTTTNNEPSFFPAPVLPALADPAVARELVADTLQALAVVVDVPGDALDRPTPCVRYTVSDLRDHVLAWLQFFAAAFADPDGAAPRPDPERYRVADDDAARSQSCSQIVTAAGDRLDRALSGDVLQRRVLLSQSFMDGPAALGMVLGEYLVHGWDLARALDRPWQPPEPACTVALEFFEGTIAPEYRGGDTGFFADLVPVPDDAPALDRLLGFAGRDPRWTPPAAC